MSLLDTINAAKKEAEEAGTLPKPTAKGDCIQSREATDDADERGGFSRRSTARAKPSREAASGVRTVSAKGSKTGKAESAMSKEERREYRRARRDAEDRRRTASRVLLGQDMRYRRGQRVWWILLGVGLACTVLSWVIGANFADAANNPTSPAGIVMVLLVTAAYACIVIAFIYDWRKVRPLRNAADKAVAAMTNKKVSQVLEADAKKFARERAERSEAKADRRRGLFSRHEQHK